MRAKYEKIETSECNARNRHSPTKGAPSSLSSVYYQKIVILVVVQIVAFILIYSLISSNGFLGSLLHSHYHYANYALTNRTPPQRKYGFHNNLGEGLFHLPNWSKDDLQLFFHAIDNNKVCYTNGTFPGLIPSKHCYCRPGYYGSDCGIPHIVWNSQFLMRGKPGRNVIVKRLLRPRRIILSVILFNCKNRSDKCEDRCVSYTRKLLSSLNDIVDLFVIAEVFIDKQNMLRLNKTINRSNISESSSVSNKFIYSKTENQSTIVEKRYLENEIVNGSLKGYSNLTLYKAIHLNAYNGSDFRNSKNLQHSAFRKVWTTILLNVGDFRPDDILLFMSPFEYPIPEIVAFLKFYEGFSEPIEFSVWKTVDFNVSQTNSTLFAPQSTLSYRLLQDVNQFLTKDTSKRAQEICQSSFEISTSHLNTVAITFEYMSVLCRFKFEKFASQLCFQNMILLNKFAQDFWPVKKWSIDNSTVKDSCIVC